MDWFTYYKITKTINPIRPLIFNQWSLFFMIFKVVILENALSSYVSLDF